MENRANDAQLVNTKAQEFAKSVRAKVDENKGSKILDFCDLETIEKGAEYTFYRYTPGHINSGELNMYDSAFAGGSGTNEQYKTEIEFIYAAEKLSMADVNSTSLNLKSSFIETLTSAINREVDNKILKKLDIITSSTTPNKDQILAAGDNTKKLTDASNVDALVEMCVYLSSIARESDNPDIADVAIYMTAHQYAELNRIEKIGDEYKGIGKKKGHLFGCKVVKIDPQIKGASTLPESIYIIPRGAIGAVSHENKVESKVWENFGYDSLMFKITRSLGVAVIEPSNIVRFTYLK